MTNIRFIGIGGIALAGGHWGRQTKKTLSLAPMNTFAPDNRNVRGWPTRQGIFTTIRPIVVVFVRRKCHVFGQIVF